VSVESLPIPEELLRQEAESIAAHYRVSADEALAALSQAFAGVPDLVRRIQLRHGEEDVTRWRAYREVVRECRQGLYYGLRRYYPLSDEAERVVGEFEQEVAASARAERVEELCERLLLLHASTRERHSSYAEFYERFFECAGVPATILDIGCGMHPLSYPFKGAGSGTKRYVAVDRDVCVIRAVSAHARVAGKRRLQAVRLSLDDPGWPSELPWRGPYELGVMLKVVPVLIRLDRAAVLGLQAAPVARLLLTGNVESLTRRQSIEARERSVLKRFIQNAGRQITGEFRVGNEFGYLAE
jgi:16S rRNA (guanine(1405)-N(7))-methyltransferase